MSEKTPRQLGTEAEALRSNSYRIESRLVGDLGQLDEYLEDVEYNNKIASGDETERWEGDKNSSEQARELSQQEQKFITDTLRPRIDYFKEASAARAQEAAAHYEQNAAGYHDLGVLEAALDGVHINAQEPMDAQKHPENDPN